MNAVVDQMTEGAKPAVTSREIPLEFRANGGEYFRIWIVNLLLTIVTLGIYSAWAKVRRLRYFYGNTSLDNSSFEYHGKPIAILKGRLIAVAVYAVAAIGGRISPVISIVLFPLFIFGVPWIIMRSRMFQMRMTSWRGLRFNFRGSYGGALGAFIGWPVLAVFTLMILLPFAFFKQVKYIVSNTSYGKADISTAATAGDFYRFCLIGLAITIGVFAVFGIVVGVVLGKGSLAQTMLGAGAEGGPAAALRLLFSAGFLMAIAAYALALMLVTAWFRANMLNTSIGRASVGPNEIYSRLKTWPLFAILFTNMLGMIVTLGLFYPWAKVRALRYQLANTGVRVNGDLNQFMADNSAGISAVSEGVGDVFDIDFGF
jgi:uncharacterized membrane protein YjgN (DUF898 family)